MIRNENFDLVLSVNPELRSKTGHPFHLDSALRTAVVSSGLEFLCFGSEDLDDEIQSLEFVEPVFSLSSWQVFQDGSPQIVSQHVEEFLTKLNDVRERRSTMGRILVYWYMGSAEVFHTLGECADDLVDVVFCFHLFSGFFLEPSSFTTAHFLHAGRLLAQLSPSKLRFSVASDSEKLRDDLKAITGIGCASLPAFASQNLLAEKSENADCGRINVVYPTDDSSKRGFDLLIEFLEAYADDFRDSLHFSVRVYPGNRKEIDRTFADKFPNVEIVEGQLSEKDFRELMGSADVILLPYLPEMFYYRTSSILYEAMALKTPSVVVKGTWLSERIESLGGGWIANGTVEGLRSVFQNIVRGGHEAIRAKAEEISTVPQVEDLFQAIMSLPFSGLDCVDFQPRFTESEVDAYYESEKEKSRLGRSLEEAEREIARLERKTDWLESELHRIINSKTWRYTESLRGMAASAKEWRRKSARGESE